MNKKLREDDEEVFRQNMFKAGPDDDDLHDADVGPDDDHHDAGVGADYHLHDDVDDLHDSHVHDGNRITMMMVMKKWKLSQHFKYHELQQLIHFDHNQLLMINHESKP